MPRAAAKVLLLVLGLWLAAAPVAAQEWVDQRRVGPLICSSEFSLEAYGSLFTDVAQIQTDLIYSLGLPAAEEPIQLYLFASRSSYREHLAEWYPDIPYRQALFVKEPGLPGVVMAYKTSKFETDVRHECTHALLHSVLPMVPLWLDEGLAEYFEMPADERAYGHSHLNAMKWRIRLGQVPRLGSLETKRSITEMGAGEYRSAWAYAHFMLHGPPEAHAELVSYFGDIRASTPPGRLSERLGKHFGDPSAEMAAHFKTWRK